MKAKSNQMKKNSPPESLLEEMVISGFGGQGILFMGQVLAYAAMQAGFEVSWMPSYGPEIRGGTANCVVIISSEEISSPIISEFDTAVVLNEPSLKRFEPAVKKNGLLIWNRSLIKAKPSRKDINIFAIDGDLEANRIGSNKLLNTVILGFFLGIKPFLVSDDYVMAALAKVLPENKHHLLEINRKAIETGKALAVGMTKKVKKAV